MKPHIQFNWILLLLITITLTDATISPKKFKKLDAGKRITGKLGVQLMTRSKLQCSVRCYDDTCKAYKYKGTGPGNCLLIKEKSSAAEGQILELEDNSSIYEKVYSQGSDETWIQPSGWNATDPALYKSCDNTDGLVLMEGTEQRNYALLDSGQVNYAWSLDHTQRQWVDLGIQTDVCLARPDNCGVAGGAISLWVNASGCASGDCGIISSYNGSATGFRIYLFSSGSRFLVYVQDGNFNAELIELTGWTHLVLNYNVQGIVIFHNGVKKAKHMNKWMGSRSTGDGRVDVGRAYTDKDQDYVSMQVDELIFFNQALSENEVQLIYNAV